MVPSSIVTVLSAWIPSSPEAIVKSPPVIWIVSLVWSASSEVSNTNVPPEIANDPVAFKPLALVVSSVVVVAASSVGAPHVPHASLVVLLFALPPPVVIVKSPPSICRLVAAWMPSAAAVIVKVPDSIVKIPLPSSSSLVDCSPSAPATIVKVPELMKSESRPLMASPTEVMS